MIDTVLQTVNRCGMLQKGDAVVVALSGGRIRFPFCTAFIR